MSFAQQAFSLQGPRGEVSSGDGVVEVPDGKVRIIPGHVVGLLTEEVLDLLIRLPVELKLLPQWSIFVLRGKLLCFKVCRIP